MTANDGRSVPSTRAIAVTATMAPPRVSHGYAVAYQLFFPPCIWPRVKRRPNELSAIDFGEVPPDIFARFMAESDRIAEEQQAIIDTLAREWFWRMPTDAELRRFDDLEREFYLLVADLERPFAKVN